MANHSFSLHRKSVYILIIFFITLSVCGYSIKNNQHFAYEHRLFEEYHKVAYNLYTEGKMFTYKGMDDAEAAPYVLRPPGYIWFLTGVYFLVQPETREEVYSTIEKNKDVRSSLQRRAANLFCRAQMALFCLSAIMLFLWCCYLFDERTSFLISLCYGLNVYLLIMTGFIHYSILHLFFIIVSGYLLTRCTQKTFNVYSIFVTGLFWGLTTLVRPFTLILPFFVFLGTAVIFKKEIKKMIIFNLVFILGMIIVVAPYTVRNYVLTKRFIAVNAQAWANIWASTEKHPEPKPNYYNWSQLWHPEGERIVNKASNSPVYKLPFYVINNLAIEDAFKKEALKNLKEEPGVYFLNIVYNIKNFSFGINSVVIKLFQAFQDPTIKFEYSKWIGRGNPQQFYSSVATRIFEVLFYLLTFLSFLGGYFAVKDKDKRLIVPVLIIGCFCFAHSITYFDFYYYYIKQPFLYLFAGYAISRIKNGREQFKTDQRSVVCANVFTVTLLFITLILNFAVLI